MTPYVESQGKAMYMVSNRYIRGLREVELGLGNDLLQVLVC